MPCPSSQGGATFAFNAGAGLEGAAIVGFAAAIGTFLSLRFSLSQAPDGPVRSIIACVLILPSLILGYNIALDVLEGMMTSALWRQAISIGYALLGGWLAFVRLTEPKN